MGKDKKKKKEYEIIKGDDSTQSNHKIEKFSFGGFNSPTTETTQKPDKAKDKFKFKKLSRLNKEQHKKKQNEILDKHITKKVWDEVRKDEAKNYKKISEKEKDKFIQNMFGTDKERVKICSSCGKELKNNYYTFREGIGEFSKGNGKLIYVCEPCLYSRTNCDNCGNPVLTNNQYQKLCHYCKPNEKCDCCGEERKNKDLSNILGVKGAYCSSCLSSADKCWNCGKPVKTDYVETHDGRKICRYCETISLMKEDEVAESYMDTLNLINRIFGIKGALNCDLGIVHNPAQEQGKTSESKCRFIVKNGRVVLSVPVGIRRDFLIGFVASEYAKLIAVKLNNKLKDPALKEDFAFWLRHLVLRRRGFNEDFQRLKQARIKSSRFFKWMNTIERSKGAKTVFSKIRKGEMKN